MTQTSLFNSTPAAATASVSTRPPTIGRALRLVAAKSGAFRELRDGETTGREFYLAELADGRIVWQFTDDGEQRQAPAAMSPTLMGDAVRYGVFVEVAS